LKIALFVHCFYPTHIYGTETYTLQLARNLKALGHEPVVVTAVFPGEPEQPSFIERYGYDGIPVVSFDKNRLPNRRVKDTYYQPEMAAPLAALIDELHPDVVHVTHLVNHTSVLLQVLGELDVPTVATFTDFFGFCYNNRLEAHDGQLCAGPSATRINCLACHLKAAGIARGGRQGRALAVPAAAMLAASTMFVAQSMPGLRTGPLAGLVQDVVQRPTLLGALYPQYRVAIAPTRFIETAYRRNGFEQPIVRIPFGVDIARHAKPARRAGPLKLGFIGQLMAHKGPDLLVDAARHALGTDGYELQLFGSEAQDPGFAAMLRKRAHGLPVQFRGTFAPDQMRNVLDGLDVLVIPSRWYENSPLVLLDALATHTPVVVSDVDGMTEFVSDGVNGLTFRRGDAGSLGAVLKTLAADRAMLERLSAATEYPTTTRAMTSATVGVYEQALALHARPAVAGESRMAAT
jgi:glycosyltransferase involved in cell wall biosynthesis